MAVTTQWVIDKMEAWAPASAAESWDNVGLLLGDSDQAVKRVLVALDASEAVVQEAVEGGYDLLVTHHPLLFHPVSRITTQDATGRKIMSLIKSGIGLFSAHTNLDVAEGGTNDLLFALLRLEEKAPLLPPATDGGFSLGRVGFLPQPMTLEIFAGYVKKRFSDACIRYAGSPGARIHKVALCAGDASGLRYCQAAKEMGCDVYITGDLRHHGTQDALEMGLSLVDITHYAGESPVVGAVVTYLQSEAAREGIALFVSPSVINGHVFNGIY